MLSLLGVARVLAVIPLILIVRARIRPASRQLEG